MLQFDALKQTDYVAESSMEDAQNNRYQSAKAEIYAPIFHKLTYEKNKLQDTINQLRYHIEKQGNLRLNAYDKPKFF